MKRADLVCQLLDVWDPWLFTPRDSWGLSSVDTADDINPVVPVIRNIP